MLSRIRSPTTPYIPRGALNQHLVYTFFCLFNKVSLYGLMTNQNINRQLKKKIYSRLLFVWGGRQVWGHKRHLLLAKLLQLYSIAWEKSYNFSHYIIETTTSRRIFYVRINCIIFPGIFSFLRAFGVNWAVHFHVISFMWKSFHMRVFFFPVYMISFLPRNLFAFLFFLLVSSQKSCSWNFIRNWRNWRH